MVTTPLLQGDQPGNTASARVSLLGILVAQRLDGPLGWRAQAWRCMNWECLPPCWSLKRGIISRKEQNLCVSTPAL